MSFDVGKVMEGLENYLLHRWIDGKVGEWAELIVIVIAELILQPFRQFTYVTAHSPTLLSLLLHHRLFIYVTWRAACAVTVFRCRVVSPTPNPPTWRAKEFDFGVPTPWMLVAFTLDIEIFLRFAVNQLTRSMARLHAGNRSYWTLLPILWSKELSKNRSYLTNGNIWFQYIEFIEKWGKENNSIGVKNFKENIWT